MILIAASTMFILVPLFLVRAPASLWAIPQQQIPVSTASPLNLSGKCINIFLTLTILRMSVTKGKHINKNGRKLQKSFYISIHCHLLVQN
jgi:hypothetical protein